MINKRKKIRILLTVLAATITIAAAIVVLWAEGVFLPSWVEWKDISMDTSFLKKGVKVQDVLNADIDRDGEEELLVLCWKIGRYGERKPFWVTHDELKWSQHIYIYEKTGTGPETSYEAKWMASDIHTLVKNWEVLDDHMIVTYTPSDEKNVWIWNSWGLERLPEESLEKYLTAKEENADPSDPDEEEKFSDDEKTSEDAADIPGKTGTDENAGDEASADGTSTDSSDDAISIIMVGDILLHDGVTSSCRKDDGTYDFSPLFKNTAAVISDADIAIVNQEVIIGGKELGISGYPSFNAPYETGDALCDAGFDVVCHGTNHALDRGKKGIINCLDYWRNSHPDMAVLGIHDSEEDADEIYITEADGCRIAILNYTYGTNGIPLPDGMPYAVDLLDKDKIAEDLAWAEENADFTIVCPHWGIEYKLTESAEQDSMAEFLTENGADLIIGTHPHVIEPVKWIESENGNRALCYFSLGNYINWTSWRGSSVADRMVGGMADVKLDVSGFSDKNDATAENNPDAPQRDSDMITDYSVIPLVSHVEHAKGEVTTYFLSDYTDELAEKNAINEQDPEFDLEYCYNLCGSVWGNITQYVVK